MIDPAANEEALRYLAAELERAHLIAAQLAGNLALANRQISELQGKLALSQGGEEVDDPGSSTPESP